MESAFLYVLPAITDLLKAEDCEAIRQECCSPNASSILPIRFQVQQKSVYIEWTCMTMSLPHTTSLPFNLWHDIVSPYLCSISSLNLDVVRTLRDKPCSMLFKLYSCQAAGRMSIATQNINIGTCIFKTPAFGAVVSHTLRTKYCHFCFKRIAKKAFQCAQCLYAIYCSRDCLHTDGENLHIHQCSALKLLDKKKSKGEILDICRLTLAVQSMQVFLGITSSQNAPFANLCAPNTHIDSKHLSTAKECADTLSALPCPSNLEVIELRRLIEKIHFNVHPLVRNGIETSGIGLFPEAAMIFNHSCDPNIVLTFEAETRLLCLYAIRDIRANEALEYSYVDVLLSKRHRREQLYAGFGFHCNCARCCNEVETEEMVKEEEQLLQLLSKSRRRLNLDFQLLFKENEAVFRGSRELLFLYRTMQLERFVQDNAWGEVIRIAEEMIRLWSCEWSLSPYNPVIDALNRQLLRAAQKLSDLGKMESIQEELSKLGRICGFS